DVRHFGPAAPPAPEMYWPAAQLDTLTTGGADTLRRMRRGLTIVVSVTDGDPLVVVSGVRAAVRDRADADVVDERIAVAVARGRVAADDLRCRGARVRAARRVRRGVVCRGRAAARTCRAAGARRRARRDRAARRP